ncbi:MAG TPA: hypothetical protein VJR94_10365 [Candidatus Nitrosocosmicus sp.]|nr:hypothetical protein [Candidatus Nitrosocosmicus sp.]
MSKEKNSKHNKTDPDNQIERQKIIDEGGTQKYGERNPRKTKDDNILLDSEH